MPTFDSSGVEISYIDEGAGPPVVLIHGFASNLQGNWRGPGIVDALVASGRKVVALDCRGHGRSAKPHDPEPYAGTQMADDAIALMDHLGIAVADLMGYSMGGMFSASLLVRHPDRFRSVILAGVGDQLVSRATAPRFAGIADAMEADDAATIADARARGFREFAERSGNDLAALGAMQRVRRSEFDPLDLSGVRLPVMILIGEGDTLVGAAEKLAAAIPGAKHVKVPGDHITAVGQPAFKQAILDFLAQASPASSN